MNAWTRKHSSHVHDASSSLCPPPCNFHQLLGSWSEPNHAQKDIQAQPQREIKKKQDYKNNYTQQLQYKDKNPRNLRCLRFSFFDISNQSSPCYPEVSSCNKREAATPARNTACGWTNGRSSSFHIGPTIHRTRPSSSLSQTNIHELRTNPTDPILARFLQCPPIRTKSTSLTHQFHETDRRSGQTGPNRAEKTGIPTI